MRGHELEAGFQVSMKHLRAILAALSILPAVPAAAESFRTVNVALYQPEPVLQERLSGDVTELAQYVKRLEAECGRFFAATKDSAAVDVVVVLKPGRRSRVWFANAVGAVSERDLKALAPRLEKLPAAQVKGGPVAFAIRGSVNGGTPAPLGSPVPVPQEWSRAITASKKTDLPVSLPEGPLRILWPDE